jgi:hypothetical protein
MGVMAGRGFFLDLGLDFMQQLFFFVENNAFDWDVHNLFGVVRIFDGPLDGVLFPEAFVA